MSYVILNNKDSRTVTGLLISKLPPITKPLMRTMVEEIDGRDGDIVTDLGYSAYDRPMEIGLFGAFNIDDVIEYFNSSGTAVFSNEPDKIYQYEIISQIDYEALLRFRTASVTFHVQPFKKKLNEPILTASSSPYTITNNGNVKAKPTLTVYGSGTVGLYLGGTQVLSIEMGSEENITIDVERLEAYKGSVLKNRLCTGNYDNLTLAVGNNSLSWTGTVTKIEISNYERWI